MSSAKALSVVRTTLLATSWITALLLVFAAIVVTALFTWEQQLPEGTTFVPTTPSIDELLFGARAKTLGFAFTCLMILLILRIVLRIVHSARAGDPFVPINARRLRHIGWLLLATEAMNIFIRAITGLSTMPAGADRLVESLPIALAILLTFLLARIFQAGAEMRAELQETI